MLSLTSEGVLVLTPCPFLLYLCSFTLFECARMKIELYVVRNRSSIVTIEGSVHLLKGAHSVSSNIVLITMGEAHAGLFPLFRLSISILGILIGGISVFIDSQRGVPLFIVISVISIGTVSISFIN